MDRHDKHHCSNIQETCKEIHVNDIYNNPKYKIQLKKENDFSFNVFVFQIGFDGSETEILKRRLNKFDRAHVFFRKCVDDYSALERACGRVPQKVDEFAERIGYRETRPDCCATCRFSRPDSGHELFSKNHCRHGLICANGEIFHPGFEGVCIRPIVDPMGICKSFERRPLDVHMNIDDHCQWTWEHHDCHPHHMHETVIKYEIDKRLKCFENRLSTQIDSQIGEVFQEKFEPVIDSKIDELDKNLENKTLFAISAAVPSTVKYMVDNYVPEIVESTVSATVNEKITDYMSNTNILVDGGSDKNYNGDEFIDSVEEETKDSFTVWGGGGAD